MFLALILTASVIWFIHYLINETRNKRLYDYSKKLKGPSPWPLFGSALVFRGMKSEEIFKKLHGFPKKYGRYYKIWINYKMFYMILSERKDIEVLLTENLENLTKADIYNVLIPWIGNGLLTSAGQKWRTHRKLITPAFHFTSLDAFFGVLNKNGEIMRDCLGAEVGRGVFNIYHYINRAALDNICETAMGVPYNVQRTLDSEYLKSVKIICHSAAERIFKPWLRRDFVFNLTRLAKEQKKAIEFIDKSTIKLIKQRREVIDKEKETIGNEAQEDEFSKPKVTFLDMLLKSGGSTLTNEEIRDEINTFMFEGHDTVSSATSFALFALANNPDVQEKAYQELMQVLGGSDAPITMSLIGDLKYLHKVVKETMRLYPPSAMIGRELSEDLTLEDGMVVPKGVHLMIDIYSVHHDPKVWPNPEVFDPERFSVEQQPFSFIPFSAGPRNCIGQKFALLEIKTLLSYVLRKYRLYPSTDPKHELAIANEIVVISKTGYHLSLELRNN